MLTFVRVRLNRLPVELYAVKVVDCFHGHGRSREIRRDLDFMPHLHVCLFIRGEVDLHDLNRITTGHRYGRDVRVVLVHDLTVLLCPGCRTVCLL